MIADGPTPALSSSEISPELETVPCYLCGARNDTEPVLTAPNGNREWGPAASFQIVRCRGCGLQFTNPRPTSAYLAAFYPQQYYAYQPKPPKQLTGLRAFGARLEWWSKLGMRQAFWSYPVSGGVLPRWLLWFLLWPLALRLRLLGRDLKIVPYRGQGRFLDVGCGTGGDLAYQRQCGLRVAGVEMNAAAAERARVDHGLDVRAGTLEQAGFPDGSFDVIHLSHVFEHVLNPAATLDVMHRLLDTDGLVILKVPNAASLSAKRYGRCWFGVDLPRHLYHFTPDSISGLLKRHGFSVIAIRQDLGAWGMWRESQRLERRNQGRPEPGDSKWLGRLFQLAEWWACLTGHGSTIAVYARKVSAPISP